MNSRTGAILSKNWTNLPATRSRVQGYADDMLSDATYERERELTRDIEERDII